MLDAIFAFVAIEQRVAEQQDLAASQPALGPARGVSKHHAQHEAENPQGQSVHVLSRSPPEGTA
jgi:hypothetical protein